MNCARFWAPLKQKSTYEEFRKCLKLKVPRDRSELPTRGFSDQIFKNSKIK
jgi:hypothetical protein